MNSCECTLLGCATFLQRNKDAHWTVPESLQRFGGRSSGFSKRIDWESMKGCSQMNAMAQLDNWGFHPKAIEIGVNSGGRGRGHSGFTPDDPGYKTGDIGDIRRRDGCTRMISVAIKSASSARGSDLDRGPPIRRCA